MADGGDYADVSLRLIVRHWRLCTLHELRTMLADQGVERLQRRRSVGPRHAHTLTE